MQDIKINYFNTYVKLLFMEWFEKAGYCQGTNFLKFVLSKQKANIDVAYSTNEKLGIIAVLQAMLRHAPILMKTLQ